MNRVDRERCYILHRRAYRETSLILELFSIRHGRIAAVARGARAAKSPMRGLTEPFVELQVSWTQRGEMATVIGLESTGSVTRYSRQALWCGLYVNELVLRLLARNDAEPELFLVYADVLDKLHTASDQARLLRFFELHLLQTIGVAPDLTHCSVSGETVTPDGLYTIDPGIGAVPVQQPSQYAVNGTLLLALAQGGELTSTQSRAAKLLMRRLIEHQLEGRPLQTPKMFRSQR